MSMKNIRLTVIYLIAERISGELWSPNYIADFASNRGIELTSQEVVFIHNNYTGV